MDRLPALITNTCLSDAQDELAQATEAEFSVGNSVPSEALTMPRKGFGPRPLNILAPQSRTLYNALVANIAALLPAPSRAGNAWEEFENIGINGPQDSYLVEFDITACYEYIDHKVLRDELVVQTADARGTQAIIDFLGDVYPMGRGLPQMHSESDLLSDAYLVAIERHLARRGFDVTRYADDFRCVVAGWGKANDLLEHAADFARQYGLVLSSDKTRIRKIATVIAERVQRIEFFERYFDTATDDLTLVDVVSGRYDDPEIQIEEPDEAKAKAEALKAILHDWRTEPPWETAIHKEHIPPALKYLEDDPDRIDDDTLTAIVAMAPVRLQNVILYLRSRVSEPGLNWDSLNALISMQRQSAWAKLWLLNCAAGLLWPGLNDATRQAKEWALDQLEDRHEVVRAQSAWFLAQAGEITEAQLQQVSTSATSLTMPALAACVGVLGLEGKFARTLTGATRLNRRAKAWGERQLL
jgi:hypothetical protein